MEKKGFERLVAAAMDALPAWVREKADNLEVTVEERPSRELCKDMGIDHGQGLLGLYEGPSLLEQEPGAASGPSRVILYRRMILDEAESDADVPRVIRETLAHEIGHHFGMAEEEIDRFEREWERGA